MIAKTTLLITKTPDIPFLLRPVNLQPPGSGFASYKYEVSPIADPSLRFLNLKYKTTEKDRADVYWRYVKELRQYLAFDYRTRADIVADLKKNILDAINCEWYDIIDYNGRLIGFFVIGTGANCNPLFDYYIEDCYIEKKYRRDRVMSRCISGYIRRHPGKYCLFIINLNNVAKKFWDSIVKQNFAHWVPMSGKYDEIECKEYGFECPKIR